jgi:hypothetical protein
MMSTYFTDVSAASAYTPTTFVATDLLYKHMTNTKTWFYTDPFDSLSSVQATTNFFYTAGIAKVFPITPFQVVACGTVTITPRFTYSGTDTVSGPLPSFVTVNPTSGDIIVTSSAPLGRTSVLVKGTATYNGVAASPVTISIKGLANDPPSLQFPLVD